VQYTYARTQSLLRKANLSEQDLINIDGQYLQADSAWELIMLLNQYPDILMKAAKRVEPSAVARYLLDASAQFNRFYHQERILTDNYEEKKSKLALAAATAYTLLHGLSILGLQAPEAI